MKAVPTTEKIQILLAYSYTMLFSYHDIYVHHVFEVHTKKYGYKKSFKFFFHLCATDLVDTCYFYTIRY